MKKQKNLPKKPENNKKTRKNQEDKNQNILGTTQKS